MTKMKEEHVFESNFTLLLFLLETGQGSNFESNIFEGESRWNKNALDPMLCDADEGIR